MKTVLFVLTSWLIATSVNAQKDVTAAQANGPMANEGQGSGTARIEGDTAVFKPDGAEDECKITLKFASGKLVVTQTGICGFGFNVTAEGTYKKVSSKKPKLE